MAAVHDQPSSLSGVYRVNTLLDKAVLAVVSCWSSHINGLSQLPATTKTRVLQLMMLRGLLTDDNIANVLHKNVTHLELCECDVSDAALRIIGRICHNLRKVDLNSTKVARTNISSQGLIEMMRGCPYLQIVYLRRCTAITDDAILELSKCCRLLKEFDIGGCPLITDVSLNALANRCSQLRSFKFSKTDVSDEGVICLARGVASHSLTEIHMDGCQQLTDESVEAVIQFCPNVSILIFHGCSKITDQSREALADRMHTSGHMTQLTWTVY